MLQDFWTVFDNFVNTIGIINYMIKWRFGIELNLST